MHQQRKNVKGPKGHGRSKSNISIPSPASDSSLESMSFNRNVTGSTQKSTFPSRPNWGRSKSSDAFDNNKPGINAFLNRAPQLPKQLARRKNNKVYNMNGLSQSLDAIPIMEDDESEAALNVPILPKFQHDDDKNTDISKDNNSNSVNTKPSGRKATFSFNDSEDTGNDTEIPVKESNLEKNAIDEDFEANWVKTDIHPLGLKRKPNANERRHRVVSRDSSSEDADASTEYEDEEDDFDTQPYLKSLPASNHADEKSIQSSTKSKNSGFLNNVFRSRSKSISSRKEHDLELGNDEKLNPTLSASSSMKSHKLLNKIFNLEGYVNGGGLTPSNNIDDLEPYHGIEEEKKNADFIVQQAISGLHFKKPEPDPAPFQVGKTYNNTQDDTGLDYSRTTGFNKQTTAETLHNRNDSALYIPTELHDNEFDDLQNFDDYSIDVPSGVENQRRTRAGIGTLLMKLNNTMTNNPFNSSQSSFMGTTQSSYTGGAPSNVTTDSEFTEQATQNLEDIISTNDYALKHHDLSEIENLTGFETMSNIFDSSTDLIEHKAPSLFKRVGKPASIRKFITHENKKRNHQRSQSDVNKNAFDFPDFYFKQQQNKQNQMKKKLFKRKKENAARITVHIADLLARQRFILLLCKAFMLYGAPTHRLEEYMAMTASVLEVDGSFVYFPGTMIVSFGDVAMRTSEMRLVRCSQGLDLTKLDDVHDIYKGVVHDRLGVDDGCKILNEIISRKPKYNKWVCTFLYAFCSASVCSWGYGGSWIDMPISFGVGAVIGCLQFVICPLNTLYSSVFEVTSSIIASFLARAIGSINGGNTFCYASIVQSALALILPGYIILCGSLELQSRNLVAGSVRMFYAFIYSLMLSFGITLGAALYGWIDHNATSATTCDSNVSPWYRFLFVPAFTVGIALCNQASWKQLPMMTVISGSGYVVTYFSSLHFKGVTELNSALGCFIIGLVANIYSRIHKTALKKFKHFGFGTSMTVSLMLPGIFVLVPSGIASQGSVAIGIDTANSIVSSSSSDDVPSSLSFGMTMIQVALGISVGLYLSTIIVYPFGKKKTGLFSL